jgi:peptidoglycan L-alanyl-D-glutamate endopeptidase CwlK
LALDRRIKFRKGLSQLYLPFYDALCSLLSIEWQPYQGIRSIEEQSRLYAQGRTVIGDIVTNADGPESAHVYGCATDWTIFTAGGQVIWLNKNDTKWNEYVDAVEKVGLRPGKEFGDIDHNELHISVPFKAIASAYRKDGMQAAVDNIKRFMS